MSSEREPSKEAYNIALKATNNGSGWSIWDAALVIEQALKSHGDARYLEGYEKGRYAIGQLWTYLRKNRLPTLKEYDAMQDIAIKAITEEIDRNTNGGSDEKTNSKD